jgi:hypothetical protein
MDKVSKMRDSLKGGLRPRDTLIPTKQTAAPTPTAPPRQQAFTETTTLPLTKEQKELIEDLGTKLQRQKKGAKKPELNWKSILRGLIGLLDENSFDGVSVENEEELHKIIREKFAR